ncbi:hypothetical protein [Pseudomonas fontis]|uniref:Uncharacterized protein n=1 Tax=Pseudomonas fontis TaxID=2942633 RepID=A0ABT5NWA3_9PSED|nr:hypothetical protein [Pseudomonas fontis]MDD0975646.1 hypothetical protein [Pseudomonas fontis]MDD0992454.1 hypothetical protein [Pseudomonas fontis]
MRIRGHIGEWPVDLTVELEPAEWAQLGGQLVHAAPMAASSTPVVQARPDDALWQAAREVLRKAGHLSGPQLLEHLEGLAGNTAGGKRLLVRLRHSADVKVQSGADAPEYHWVG